EVVMPVIHRPDVESERSGHTGHRELVGYDRSARAARADETHGCRNRELASIHGMPLGSTARVARTGHPRRERPAGQWDRSQRDRRRLDARRNYAPDKGYVAMIHGRKWAKSAHGSTTYSITRSRSRNT